MEELSFEVIEIDNKERAINEIMDKYSQQILQLVFSYVNNKETAEDLTQDIFVKCYKSFHTYNKKSKVKTWLWRIAINHCKDYLKSWYSKNVMINETEVMNNSTENEIVEQTVIQNDEDRRLALTVMNLPINYREVIYLFYFEEMTIKDIVHVTKINENTVKTRLKRAKEILKEQLEEK
ncbi:sigma-70 family RNA polymerase sigma factor [Metabacillus fastidiosus]|uniref:sigma-70 family RNA polymerase sigma factor n=1 Tax=Metabacillus fastidiosus TaxID=1458 RepID=UPI003D265CDF